MVLAFRTSSIAFALCFHALFSNGFASCSIAASTGLGFVFGFLESLRSLVGFRIFLGHIFAGCITDVLVCRCSHVTLRV